MLYKNNKCVEIYFVIGKCRNGNNEIDCKAEVLEIESNANGITSPDISLTPKQYIMKVKRYG